MNFFSICIQLTSYLFLISGTTSCLARQVKQQTGMISGSVQLHDGNCMPTPGQPPCEPTPTSAWIYFTQQSEGFERSLLIDSVFSDAMKGFSLALPVGDYSVFVKYKDMISCDYTDCAPKCYCHPIEILKDSSLSTTMKINLANW